jgi:ABC-type multidrug transport system permease subunit
LPNTLTDAILPYKMFVTDWYKLIFLSFFSSCWMSWTWQQFQKYFLHQRSSTSKRVFHLQGNTKLKQAWVVISRFISWTLIDYLLFYVPLKNISLIWRRHYYRLRILCSALRAFEQGGIFIVPHLLWYGAIRRTAPFNHLTLMICMGTYSYPDPHGV